MKMGMKENFGKGSGKGSGKSAGKRTGNGSGNGFGAASPSLRRAALALALILALALAACGGGSGGGGAATTTTAAATTTTAAAEAATEADATTEAEAATEAAATTAAATEAATEAVAAEPAQTVGEGPISAEKITLKAFEYVLDNQSIDFPSLWYYDELEKETNIHIEWEQVKNADWETKINLMFASGDYPDVILRGGTVDLEEYGVSQGILIPLDDYLEANMPNYWSRLFMNGANESLPSSDGKTYQIGNLIAQNVNHEGNDYINKAWLDKLGLEIPKTVDELTEVLRAFKTGDPNGNGVADEIPMSGGDLVNNTQGVYTHFAKFGVPLHEYLYATVDENDKVRFYGDYPGFRAACEWLNLLYREGLLDPESITQDSNVWATKVNAGNVGFTTYLRLINTALLPEIIPDFVSIIPPASEYGVQVPRLMEIPTFGAALTSANKYVPETLQWLDRQLETEHMMVAYNGPLKEGGPIEPTMEVINGKYNIKYIPENNGLYNIAPVWHAQFFAPGDYYFDIYEMPPHRVERFNTSREYEEAGVLEPKSYFYLYQMVKPNNEDAIEIKRLFDQIDKFMKETISTFITSGVTDASWEEYLKTCDNIGVQKYVELYQAAYDKYLANK
ncbi:MAG: extracellular solute-binding protein [Clostridiales bacterium]|jgi:putative aldouronate transport system substrate-binding protein|nr:extracellular solute-binding protein [Clostridiales bacterium]